MNTVRSYVVMVTVLCGSLLLTALGQTGSTPPPRPSPELLLENDYVRVFRVDVQPGEVPIRDAQLRDVVIVAMSDRALDSDAQVRFVPENSPPDLPPATTRYAALLVELKKHWDLEVRPCAPPMTCSRRITVAGQDVGETRFLFSNGFVSAYRHHLVPGGTLDSSYYSSKGTNRILVIALTDLGVSLGGVAENLRSGQVYFSDQTEVEVNASKGQATWVVVRLLTKH